MINKIKKRLTADDFKKIKNAVYDNLECAQLIDLLLSKDESIHGQINQIRAANSLGLLKDKGAIYPLIDILRDGKIYSRLAASEALGAIGLPAIQILIEYLGKIPETQDIHPPKKAFWDKSYYVHDPAARTLVKIGKASIPSLVECIKVGDDFTIQQAIDALGRIGDKAVVPFLEQEFYKRDSYLTKWKIVRALGELRDSNAVDFLVSIVKNPKYESFIRWETADSLGKLGDSSAVGILIALLEDDNEEIKRMSARALGKIGDKRAILALETLRNSLAKNSSRNSTQYEVTKALLKICKTNKY